VSDWLDPPTGLTLSRSEIHLWRAPLDLAQSRAVVLQAILNAEEQARASRFRFDRPRCDFIIARSVLRIILSRYLDIDPRHLEFQYGAHGKPELAVPQQKWLQFSLAHSGGWVLYGMACERPIGIDLEEIRPVASLEKLVEQFFAPAEYAVFAGLPWQQKLSSFYSAWTRKEAYVKARGLGMSLPLNQYAVTVAPETVPALIIDEKGPVSEDLWSFLDVEVAPGYAAALAVRGSMEYVSQWHWHE
jgi:4'-phosphopantetheinyl transferase